MERNCANLVTIKLTTMYVKLLTMPKNTIHKFSSYVLSPNEGVALEYGLEYHILGTSNILAIKNKFELIYQISLLLKRNYAIPIKTIVILRYAVDISKLFKTF